MVEFNPTIPNNVVYIQEDSPEINHGSSLLAFKIMMEKKSYSLIGTHGCNALFVMKPYAHLFVKEAMEIDELHDDSKYKMIYFQLYDGTIKNAGINYLLWNKTVISEQDIQLLPISLRTYISPDKIIQKTQQLEYSIFNSYPALRVTAADLNAQKILVWGAGGRLKQFLDAGGHRIKDITVTDGNSDLHGSTAYALQIANPKNLDLYSFNIIIICSTYFYEILADINNLAQTELLHIRYYDSNYPIY